MQIKTKNKLVSRHHTGKKLPHHHTSYGSLLFILMLVALSLTGVSWSASAQDAYQTYAVVPGPVPSIAPQITNIASGQSFAESPQLVRGTCPSNTLVKLFKNEVFAGDASCRQGAFSLSTDMFIGNNTLVVRAYNTNDASSPDSTAITVRFAPPGTQLNGTSEFNAQGAPINQFYITTEAFYRGANAGDTLTWPLSINGGAAPYAVSVGWGDGKTDVYSRGAAGNFDIKHVYTKGPQGNSGYTIVINATDEQGSKSFLQIAALVNNDGKSAIAAGTNGRSGNSSGGQSMGVKIAWQLFAATVIAVVGFWIGERREKRLLHKNGLSV